MAESFRIQCKVSAVTGQQQDSSMNQTVSFTTEHCGRPTHLRAQQVATEKNSLHGRICNKLPHSYFTSATVYFSCPNKQERPQTLQESGWEKRSPDSKLCQEINLSSDIQYHIWDVLMIVWHRHRWLSGCKGNALYNHTQTMHSYTPQVPGNLQIYGQNKGLFYSYKEANVDTSVWKDTGGKA